MAFWVPQKGIPATAHTIGTEALLASQACPGDRFAMGILAIWQTAVQLVKDDLSHSDWIRLTLKRVHRSFVCLPGV